MKWSLHLTFWPHLTKGIKFSESMWNYPLILMALLTVMLVTSLSWWLYDGDWFQILVAESLCWRLFRYVGDFLNVLNRSPTSKSYHQHIWSATSVTNIDVTFCRSRLPWCWWLDYGNGVGELMVTEWLYWRLFQCCHQHIPKLSPTPKCHHRHPKTFTTWSRT